MLRSGRRDPPQREVCRLRHRPRRSARARAAVRTSVEPRRHRPPTTPGAVRHRQGRTAGPKYLALTCLRRPSIGDWSPRRYRGVRLGPAPGCRQASPPALIPPNPGGHPCLGPRRRTPLPALRELCAPRVRRASSWSDPSPRGHATKITLSVACADLLVRARRGARPAAILGRACCIQSGAPRHHRARSQCSRVSRDLPMAARGPTATRSLL